MCGMNLLIHSQTLTWSLGMDKQFDTTLFWACDYISMQGFELNHASKRSTGLYFHCSIWYLLINGYFTVFHHWLITQSSCHDITYFSLISNILKGLSDLYLYLRRLCIDNCRLLHLIILFILPNDDIKYRYRNINILALIAGRSWNYGNILCLSHLLNEMKLNNTYSPYVVIYVRSSIT